MIFLAVARRHFANLSFYVKCYKLALNVVQKDILKGKYEKKFLLPNNQPPTLFWGHRILRKENWEGKDTKFSARTPGRSFIIIIISMLQSVIIISLEIGILI